MDTVDISEFMNPKRCKIGALPLSEEQRAKLESALKASKDLVTNARIKDVIESWGFYAAASTIGQHRNHRCGCE